MAMKYKYLSRALKQNPKWGVAFKFQWGILCDYATDQDENNKWACWLPSETVVSTRVQARQMKRCLEADERARNVRMVRRLVQVHWQPYRDTFTYSEKGNGNGR